MNTTKRSPLKSNPLRMPGQSVDEEIKRILYDEVDPLVLVLGVLIAFAVVEWYRLYFASPPNPILITVMVLGTAPYCAYRLIGCKKRIDALKLGRDGERAVGQTLELLREKGYRIFHDLIGENFNIDHVIICEQGLFVIETKTYSKPEKGESRINWDGNEIIVNGFNTGNRIPTQAKAEAGWLREMIKDSTGKDFAVKPVVVFPGWYIDSTDQKLSSNLWVLNPKALPHFIQKAPKVLSKDDMMLVAYHLSRFVRASYK